MCLGGEKLTIMQSAIPEVYQRNIRKNPQDWGRRSLRDQERRGRILKALMTRDIRIDSVTVLHQAKTMVPTITFINTCRILLPRIHSNLAKTVIILTGQEPMRIFSLYRKALKLQERWFFLAEVAVVFSRK